VFIMTSNGDGVERLELYCYVCDKPIVASTDRLVYQPLAKGRTTIAFPVHRNCCDKRAQVVVGPGYHMMTLHEALKSLASRLA